MKTVVILSTDNLGMTVADMLNPREMKLVGMGDTRQETWNVFSDLEKGELKEEIEGMPIMPADLAVALQPDVLVIAATDSEKSHALEYMAIRAEFLNDIVFIRDLHEQFSIRCSVLRRLCRNTGPSERRSIPAFVPCQHPVHRIPQRCQRDTVSGPASAR